MPSERPPKSTGDRADEGPMRQVGRIVGSFGLRGHLKVSPLTEFLERFEPGRFVWIQGQRKKVLDRSEHKGQLRLQIEGVTSPEEAEELRWEYVCVPSSERPRLEEGEYLVEDLVGLQVVGTDGRRHGAIEEVIPGVAYDLARAAGTMFPLAKQFVKQVDLDKGEMLVELVYGMAEGEQAEEVR